MRSIVKETAGPEGPAVALDTGLRADQAARAGFARLLAEPGLLVGPGGAEPWQFRGAADIDGSVHLYGAPFRGRALMDLVESPSAGAHEAALDALRLLCGVHPEGPLYPASVVAVPDERRALILPGKTVLRALESAGPADALEGALRWTHPDLTGDAALVFTLAALAYRVLCGAAPYGAPDAEAAKADMRDGRALPARFARPGLKPRLAAALDAALRIGEKSAPAPTLEALGSLLGEPGSGAGGLARSLEGREAAVLEAARARWLSRSEKRIGGKRFLRRRGGALLAAVAAAAAVAAIAWSVVGGRAERFTTAGLSPRETVEAFYAGLDGLDTEKMGACVVSGTAKGDIDAATSMYVVFRVRSAYEREGGHLSAADWLAAGAPETTRAVYGLVGLSIEQDGAEDRFVARYDFYAPAGTAERRTDRLGLAQVKGAWRIAAIERGAERLPSP